MQILTKLLNSKRTCCYLPIHIMLNMKPFWTLFETNWSGRLSKPTCPESVKFLICSSTFKNGNRTVIILFLCSLKRKWFIFSAIQYQLSLISWTESFFGEKFKQYRRNLINFLSGKTVPLFHRYSKWLLIRYGLEFNFEYKTYTYSLIFYFYRGHFDRFFVRNFEKLSKNYHTHKNCLYFDKKHHK